MEGETELPENIVKHVVNFLYIISFLAGISGITLAIMLAKRYKTATYRKLAYFVMAFFFNTICSFLFFYRGYFMLDWELNLTIVILEELSTAALIYSWVMLIWHVTGQAVRKKYIYVQVLRIISASYIFVWLFICLYFLDQDYDITTFWAKILAIGIDTVFLSFSLWLVIKYTLIGRKKAGDTGGKILPLVLSISMVLYALVFYLEDISLIFYPVLDIIFTWYPFDPIIVIYLALNIFIVAYIYKNELMFQDSEVVQEPVKTGNGDETNFFEEIGTTYRLTNREKEMLHLVYQGQSNSQIAENLCISPFTVKRHLNNIFKKMAVNTRVELMHLLITSK